MKNRLKQIRIALDLNQGDFASRVDVLQQQLSKYERGENKPSSDFFTKLAEKADVNINWLLTGKGEMFTSQNGTCKNNATEITYYENPGILKTIKNPAISSVWIDTDLINKIWHLNSNNLKIMQMTGDSMNGGKTPVRNRDILLIDTSITDIMLSGIYAYTTKNDSLIFVNGLTQKIDGSVTFFYRNENYSEVIYNLKDLEKINFKVIGRIIKNLSNCL